MNSLPAQSGWQWIKEGFALFRKQPAEVASLFFGYVLFMIGISIIPFLGQVLPVVLIPVFSMVFMQACAYIDKGEQVSLTLLPAAFRSRYLRRLLVLGVLYLLAMLGAVAASSLIDGGLFWQSMTGQIVPDEKMMRESDMTTAMMFAAAIYAPAAMAFWYAAPLIVWQDMSVSKALFYSFFSVLRAIKAFFIYGLAWMMIGAILPAFLSALLIMLTGLPSLSMVILMPLSLLLTIILYCTFYPTYTHVFGQPETPSLEQNSSP